MDGRDDFAAFDTEDNSEERVALTGSGHGKKLTLIAGAGGGRQCLTRGAVSPFLTFLSKLPGQTRVYAHNLQYDLGNLFGGYGTDQKSPRLDQADVRMVGGRLISARWKNVVFMDSFNLWPVALKTVGETVGLHKGARDVKDSSYVWRDVAIVQRAIRLFTRFCQDHGVERPSATLGGTAVKLWLAGGGGNWFCGSEYARSAYFGGRVELFNRGGTGRISYVDINSLYPWCMTQPFPSACDDYTDEARAGLEKTRRLPGWGVATVTVRVPKMDIAPLPFRDGEGRVIFPTGEFSGTWTVAEINNALDMGAEIVDVSEVHGSLEAAYFYRDFTERFYELRRTETDKASKMMLKLCLNNLYGQLGMGGVITRSCVVKETDFDAAGNYTAPGVPYGRLALRESAIPLPAHVNYLHAAHVTSYARLRLLKFLRLIPARDLIYCDTDSIIFWRRGAEAIPFEISDRLGEMKLEGEADRCFTHAPKVYQFGDDYKAKGVRRDQARTFIETGSAEMVTPYKLRESIRFYEAKFNADGRMLRGKNSRPVSVWRKVMKVKQTEYDKKRSGRDGRYFPKIIG